MKNEDRPILDTSVLEIKKGISRARDTEGYAIASLYVDGDKVASCNGGGYDMHGTVIGAYLKNAYQDRLKMLSDACASGLRKPLPYGMRLRNDGEKVSLDGATGEECMRSIAREIGLEFRGVRENSRQRIIKLADHGLPPPCRKKR